MRVVFALFTIGLLTACGVGDNETGSTSSVSAAKFKGAKIAPSQDVMNRVVGNEWFDRRGGYFFVKKSNEEACKGAAKFQPEKWPTACAAAMNAWKDGVAFTPSECRKGDERDGYSGELIQPVSCIGLVEDPSGEEKRIFVFHKPYGEWKAWIGPSFPGTRKNRQ